jgi:4-amino-4-deoxy-L-arabinose transferase-like glycosyltransferase
MIRAPAAAALLVLCSIPVIFWDLGRYGPSNMDELFYHYVARNMLETGNWLRIDYTGEHRLYDTFLNAPLYYWAKAGIIAVIGDGWFSMRILSALCGLGSVLMTWHLVRRIAPPAAALLAGLIQLTTLQFVYLHSARTGEMETAITLLVTLCAHLFLRALIEGRGFWAHHLCVIALAHLKLPLGLVPLLAELAWFALDRDARARFREWLVAGLVLLPLALAWRVYQALAHWEGFVGVVHEMMGQASGGKGMLTSRNVGVLGNLRFYAATLMMGGYPWVLLYPLALLGVLVREREGVAALRWRLLGVFLATVIVFFTLLSKHWPWYVMPAYPFLCAFTGAWLWRVWREGPRPWECAGLAVALAVALFARVPGLDFDPISAPWPKNPDLTWAAPFGISVLWGLPLIAVGLAIAARNWRISSPGRQPAAGVVAAVGTVCLLVASVRVMAPLRFAGYEAPAEAMRREIDEMRERGEPIPYPVVYDKKRKEPGLMKLRYFFADDFWIRAIKDRRGERSTEVLLFERSRGVPPVDRIRDRGDDT